MSMSLGAAAQKVLRDPSEPVQALAVCLRAADLHFKFGNPGGWPAPAPQPNLPRAPLDVVVMVKLLGSLHAGAICAVRSCGSEGSAPFFLPPLR